MLSLKKNIWFTRIEHSIYTEGINKHYPQLLLLDIIKVLEVMAYRHRMTASPAFTLYHHQLVVRVGILYCFLVNHLVF